jgi:hypothetical protein
MPNVNSSKWVLFDVFLRNLKQNIYLRVCLNKQVSKTDLIVLR